MKNTREDNYMGKIKVNIVIASNTKIIIANMSIK